MKHKYKTEEHVVAFIDVLGAKKKIQDDVNQSLNIVHKAYNDALNFLSVFYGSETEALRPKVKIFSDNIVIAVPTNIKGAASALISVMIFAGLFQHQFLHQKYLVRGGISLGNFFIDDVMLWGTALTRAYEIECSVAIYPRIVLDPNLVRMLNVFQHDILKTWVFQDVDGLLFVDYMQEKSVKDKDLYLPLLLHRIDEAEQLLVGSNNNLKVQQKIIWHLNYLKNCLFRTNHTDEE